jgi:hypothetical protein
LTWVWRIFLYFAGEYIKGQVVTRAKRRGVAAYLRALQGTRHAVLIALGAFFFFHAILLAGFGALVTGMLLLDLERRTMLEILFGIFLALFLIPVTAIAIGMSERLWYKVSGAQKMVEDIRGHQHETRESSEAA